ncbi:S-adenosyl-L-methionine-dependent methyltransferase [Lipomyces oligophaga]|uniref:S-adenosyl-L-methionine-dependent methyltransferase n=1 Tax=Lipomyces oligophaga TaxID=45792 RepID=UPI0034CD5F44
MATDNKAQANRTKRNPKQNSDRAIQETNNSSIVSKRSTERLYYPQPAIPPADSDFPYEGNHFFRHFVQKPQRRSPLINHGYWIRMEAVHTIVKQFLESNSVQRKVIVNLGCGYDPLPFQYLAKRSTSRSSTVFVDVDYPDLITLKVNTVDSSSVLSAVIGSHKLGAQIDSIALSSSSYYAIRCDLSNISALETSLKQLNLLDENCDFLFIAEVSLTYMDTSAADSVIKWASTATNGGASFALLEQIIPAGPAHPFASTMINHFNRLNTPIKSIYHYPTLHAQKLRFLDLGWNSAVSRDLLEVWVDDVSLETKKRISSIEPFDEWEEFYLFCQHYVFLVASTSTENIDEERVNLRNSHESQIAWTKVSHGTSRVQRKWAAAATLDNTIISFGGLGSCTRLSTSCITAYEDELFEVQDYPTPSARMCAAMANLSSSKFLMCGGRNSPTAVLSDTWILNLDSKQWQKAAAMPFARHRHVCATISSGKVIVFGGFYPSGESVSEWILYDASINEWICLSSNVELGACFSPSFCWTGSFGILGGGFSLQGHIYQRSYRWMISGHSIVLEPISTNIFNRAGASLMPFEDKIVLVGGVVSEGLLQVEKSIVLVNTLHWSSSAVACSTEREGFPMLVGFNMLVSTEGEIVISGGGAVCFSFGAYWNRVTVFNARESKVWKVIEQSKFCADNVVDHVIDSSVENGNDMSKVSKIRQVFAGLLHSIQDWENIYQAGLPVIIKNADIGDCVLKWTPEYLKSSVGGDREVVVHTSEAKAMNFQKKNFRYITMPFERFIDEVFLPSHGSARYYLRSLSASKPAGVPAIFKEDFPTLAEDFKHPVELQEFLQGKEFSSPFRISSPQVGMWLHYDVMANFLVQISGTKRIRVYAPSDITKLSFPAGASSSTIRDIFATEVAGVTPFEGTMAPGDILFLPSMWLHATNPLTASISINTFFKDLSSSVYATGRDVYGNRDLKVYENSRIAIAKIRQAFQGEEVPEEIKKFYLLRLADELVN